MFVFVFECAGACAADAGAGAVPAHLEDAAGEFPDFSF